MDCHLFRLSTHIAALLLALCACCGVQAAVENPARFSLWEIRVEGNTVLPRTVVERAVYPFLGPGRTAADLERAQDALAKAYQEAGYLTVLVDLPAVAPDGAGVAVLKVIEGKLGALKVSGNRYVSRQALRAAVPALQVGQVPYFPQVQKEIEQVNQSADRRVTPVLSMGSEPGTFQAELKVEDKPALHGSVEVNDRAGPNTRPLRLNGSLRYDDLWQSGHSAMLNYQVSPQDTTEVRAISGSYSLPVGHGGDLLSFSAVHSRSNVVTLGDLTLVGNGDSAGLHYVLSLPSEFALSQNLVAGVDFKRYAQLVGVAPGSSPNTPLSYWPLSAQYNASFGGADSLTQVSLSAVVGPGRLFRANDADFENARAGAQADFAYVRWDLAREQKLYRGFSLYVRAGGQAASGPLVTYEQYTAGGADSVRGYLEAEQAGDDALFGRAELRSPPLGSTGWWSGLYTLAFVDAAGLQLQEVLPGQQSRYTLYAYGAGIHLRPQAGLEGSFEVGVPQRDGQTTKAHEPRALFRLAYQF